MKVPHQPVRNIIISRDLYDKKIIDNIDSHFFKKINLFLENPLPVRVYDRRHIYEI